MYPLSWLWAESSIVVSGAKTTCLHFNRQNEFINQVISLDFNDYYCSVFAFFLLSLSFFTSWFKRARTRAFAIKCLCKHLTWEEKKTIHRILYPQLHTLLARDFIDRNLFSFVSIMPAWMPHTMTIYRHTLNQRLIRRNSLHSEWITCQPMLSLLFNQNYNEFDAGLTFFFSFLSFLVSFTGSPGILTSAPPSPSCSHPNGNGDVFFPRGSSSSSGSGSSSSSVQPSTPSSIRMHDDYRSEQWSPRSVSVPRRR